MVLFFRKASTLSNGISYLLSLPYDRAGRYIWHCKVSKEGLTFSASPSLLPDNLYWRGTTEQRVLNADVAYVLWA